MSKNFLLSDEDIDEACEEDGPVCSTAGDLDHLKESKQFVAGVLRAMKTRGFNASKMASVLAEGITATAVERRKGVDDEWVEDEVPDHKTRLKYLKEFRELVFGKQAGTALLSLTIGGKSSEPKDVTPPPPGCTIDIDVDGAEERVAAAKKRREG